MREIVRRVENANLTVVPKVKHLLPLEDPVKIANLIDNEIKKKRCF